MVAKSQTKLILICIELMPIMILNSFKMQKHQACISVTARIKFLNKQRMNCAINIIQI